MSARAIASATSYASSIVYGAMLAKSCCTSHGQPVSWIAQGGHHPQQSAQLGGGFRRHPGSPTRQALP